MRLIYNSDAQRLQKDFDDKTPTSVSEMLRAERTSSVPLELFLVDNDGGYATPGTSDYEVVIGRSAQELTTGLLKLTWTGTTEAIDLSKPKLATRIESALNAVAEIDTAGGVDVVGLTNGRGYQITFRSVGSRAAITAGVSESMQPATATLTEVTAGDLSTKEVQLLTLEEASLAEVSTGSWSASSAPALTISTLVAGTSSTREVQKLSISGDPAPGSFFVVSDSEPISTEATAAQVKTILNSALSSDIGSVKKTGEREWQVTYKTNGDKAALSAGTHNLVRRPAISASLSLNTTALAYASNSDGSDLSIGFTLRKSNEVIISEKISLSEPFAEVLGSTAMLTNDSIGALFKIDSNEINKGQAITISGGLTYNGSTHDLAAPFLPLAGGTMTGDVVYNDNIKAIFGTSSDGLEIYHDGSNSIIKDSGTGDLIIQGSDDIWLRTQGGNNYANFNSNGSVDLYYNNSKKFETTDTGATISGKLIVNGDLDVSGSTTQFESTVVSVQDPIFTVGGSSAPESSDNMDRGIEFRYYSGSAKVGFFGYDDSEDAFTFLTDATNNSEVFSGTLGKLRIGDLSLASSDITLNDSHFIQWTDGNYKIQGSKGGGYLKFYTGSTEAARFDSAGHFLIPADNKIQFGDNQEYRIDYDSSGYAYHQNITGPTYFVNSANNKDFIFKTTTGDTTSEILRLDGSAGSINVPDNVKLKLGTSSDLQIYSDGSNTTIDSFNRSNMLFRQHFADGDMTFQCDDGSGGVETYFRLDGSASIGNPITVFPDNSKLTFGDSYDLRVFHDGNNKIESHGSNDLYFKQQGTDRDFIFEVKPSGVSTEILRLDGSTGNVGIGGVTSPSQALEVGTNTDVSAQIGRARVGYVGFNDYAGFSHLDHASTSGYGFLQGPNGNTFINCALNQQIFFRYSNTTMGGFNSDAQFYVNNNCGIGVTNPNAKLEINQTATTRGLQVIRNEAQANTEALVYFTDENTASTQPTVRIRNDGSGDALQVIDGNNPAFIVDGNGDITQNYINYTDGSNYEALKISAESDHIKYDTTSIGSFASNVRDHRFYVNGTQRFYVTNSGAWTTGNFYINGSGALRQASDHLNLSTSTQTNNDIIFKPANTEAVRIGSNGVIDFSFANSTVKLFESANNDVRFGTNTSDAFSLIQNGSRRLLIAATGKVGIASTDPSPNADLTLGGGELCMAETTEPTADANFGKIYCKSDNKLYFQDGAGTEHEIAFV